MKIEKPNPADTEMQRRIRKEIRKQAHAERQARPRKNERAKERRRRQIERGALKVDTKEKPMTPTVTERDVHRLRAMASSRVCHGHGDYGPPDQYDPWITDLADRLQAMLTPPEKSRVYKI